MAAIESHVFRYEQQFTGFPSRLEKTFTKRQKYP
jgi:hypothetical protein